ncbi:T9SS type A sorting domain-containing protein [Formosa sediminum]|uniref:T9SS type A sorting domain-containing protein n=1 Tax=Formosa sediminum TaxID=2594004 RepID=A0A516GQR5_9FLAO|nr:chondroitinase-B domain-containing protein [Formosa sediminum]QDO93858.1 T9SS type A sorting domain-containing protein [Formosa sediminum]
MTNNYSLLRSINYGLNKQHLLFLMLSLFAFCVSAQTYIEDLDELEDLLDNVTAGDVFIIKNGTYNDFELSISEKHGNSGSPIVIQAETVGGVTLTGESHFVFKKSSYITLQGFIFDCEGDNSLVKLEGSNNIRITRNVFELKTEESIKWVYIGGIWDDHTFQYTSHNNRIDHNTFQNKTTPGHYITIDGTNDGDSDFRQSTYDRIDHNYFKNNGPRAENEQESIRIGWSEMSKSSGYTTVEFNLFEDCDGDPEIVSVKSCDNVVRHNTFRKSYGTLSLRHGNRNRIEGNYFFGDDKEIGTSNTGSTLYTGGIRVYGTDHIIINNYFENLEGTRWDAPITITQGDAIDGESSSLSKHFRAERVTIAYNTLVNNTYGIEIGFDNNGNYSKKVKDVMFANNLVIGKTNSLVNYVDGNDQGDGVSWSNNLMYPEGDAILISDNSTFNNNEVTVENPNLEFTNGVWKSTAASPLFTSGTTSVMVNEDIEGQNRPTESNAGADHFSTESVRYAPLEPEDVGPYSDEGELEEVDQLSIAAIDIFTAEAGTQETAVTSNMAWDVSVDQDWISASPTNGENNETIEIMVSENTTTEERTGTLTIASSTLTRTITITQMGKDPSDGLDLLDPDTVFASAAQDSNGPENTLDDDFDTRWSAEGDGQTITYDLGEINTVSLLKIAFHNGTSRKTYFEIAVSENGTEFTTLTNRLESSGTTDEYENFILNATTARYVQIIGYGNENSAWTSITEVRIYGTEDRLSVSENSLTKTLKVFPNPAQKELHILDTKQQLSRIEVYNIQGQKILSQPLQVGLETTINVSSFAAGTYILKASNSNNETTFKRFIINN